MAKKKKSRRHNRPAKIKPVPLTRELILQARESKKIRKKKAVSEDIPAEEVGEVLGISKARCKGFKVTVRIDGTVDQALLVRPLAVIYNNLVALTIVHCCTLGTTDALFNEDDAEDLLDNDDMLPFLTRVAMSTMKLRDLDPAKFLTEEELALKATLDDTKKKST